MDTVTISILISGSFKISQSLSQSNFCTSGHKYNSRLYYILKPDSFLLYYSVIVGWFYNDKSKSQFHNVSVRLKTSGSSLDQLSLFVIYIFSPFLSYNHKCNSFNHIREGAWREKGIILLIGGREGFKGSHPKVTWFLNFP